MFEIESDIRRARTLPSEFYLDDRIFEQSKERIFRNAYHFVGSVSEFNEHRYLPKTILPAFLDEPVLLIQSDDGSIRAFSNVCTHRGNLLVNVPGNDRIISCGYHGRCFGHDGKCRSMPAFEDVENFPSEEDHLTEYQVYLFGPLIFVAFEKNSEFVHAMESIRKRMVGFDIDALRHAPELTEDFQLYAHWALYNDNYLEGFHVPFVHPGLNNSLAMEEYHYETFDHHNLQLGIANEGEDCFVLRSDSPEHGRYVYAYYWWVWPNIMINCYPWGISFNVIEPISKSHTQVVFETYLFDGSSELDRSATGIHQTEIEDEEIVLQVQKGIHSKGYVRGRYSPTHERCVHHFHQLISQVFKKG